MEVLTNGINVEKLIERKRQSEEMEEMAVVRANAISIAMSCRRSFLPP